MVGDLKYSNWHKPKVLAAQLTEDVYITFILFLKMIIEIYFLRLLFQFIDTS